MENFGSLLERDYGFKSGKNSPMVSSSAGGSSGGGGYGGLRRSVPGARMSAGAYGQEDPFGLGRKNEGSKSGRSSYGSRDDLFSSAAYDDVFGGPPKSSEAGARYDDVFGGAPQGAPVFDEQLLPGFGGSTPKVKSSSGSFHSSPRRSDRNHFVSSEPGYDDLLPGFGFLPKSRTSSETKPSHEPDPFVPMGTDPLASSSAAGSSAATFDDSLLPGFESAKSRTFSGDAKSSRQPDPLVPIFDDPLPPSNPPASSPFDDEGLLPGFSSESAKSRSFRDAKSSPVQDSFRSLGDDPVSSGIPSESSAFDLLDVFNEPQVPPSATSSRAPGNGKVDRFDSFDSFPSSPGNSSFFKDSSRKSAEDAKQTSRAGSGSPEEAAPVPEANPSDDISEVPPYSDPFFPSQTESGKSAAGLGSSNQPEEEVPAWDFPTSNGPQLDRGSSGGSRARDLKDAWLTIDNMRLMTQPSPVPPPARRPPPLPGSGSSFREKGESREAEFVTSSSPTSTPEEDLTASSAAPPSYEQAVPGWKDFKIPPSRDEEKEREAARAAREKRRQEREEAKAAREIREREMKEREMKEREIRQAREQERLRRDKEREKDRAAVRVATLEARERAAQEAREKAERSAVERVTGEARERAASHARARVERAAVERANAEARERAEVRAAVERAAAEARERAERAAAEKAAVERAAGEVRERAVRAAAERAAVERAQTEARERAARVAAEKAAVERAAAEARERMERSAAEKAAAARERSHQQRKSENDLESFFGSSAASASSDTRHRPSSMNNSTNVFGETRRTSSATATTTSSMDDWTSIFGATPSADDSQDKTGRNSKAWTERQQHTRERAARAIAEINQRDLETQREQAEKQRAGDVLDAEIKRWAAGKEGNLRALLSTLQYVLWPECGWTPVSLTDLINPASVKKTYRKATLYVHPDKVQQKGATVKQKYIAEKVFDLLKEASNKFNSEELF